MTKTLTSGHDPYAMFPLLPPGAASETRLIPTHNGPILCTLTPENGKQYRVSRADTGAFLGTAWPTFAEPWHVSGPGMMGIQSAATLDDACRHLFDSRDGRHTA